MVEVNEGSKLVAQALEELKELSEYIADPCLDDAIKLLDGALVKLTNTI